MKKIVFLFFVGLAFVSQDAKAQGCVANDVINVVSLKQAGMDVGMFWTPNPHNCNTLVCPPLPHVYNIEVEWGEDISGGGLINWGLFPETVSNYMQLPGEPHGYVTQNIYRVTTHIRIRIQVVPLNSNCPDNPWSNWFVFAI